MLSFSCGLLFWWGTTRSTTISVGIAHWTTASSTGAAGPNNRAMYSSCIEWSRSEPQADAQHLPASMASKCLLPPSRKRANRSEITKRNARKRLHSSGRPRRTYNRTLTSSVDRPREPLNTRALREPVQQLVRSNQLGFDHCPVATTVRFRSLSWAGAERGRLGGNSCEPLLKYLSRCVSAYRTSSTRFEIPSLS